MRCMDGFETGFEIRGHYLIHEFGKADAVNPGNKI
jgi:hypothetical protein